MVHILTNVGFGGPVQRLIERWDGALAPDVRLASYQSTLVQRRLPAGTYIFTDMDRIPRGDVADVHALWDQLRTSGAALLVNDPRRVRLRYDLLRHLHSQGVNDFTIYRSDENLDAVRFPVFVRCEHDHGGPRTGLLYTRMELDRALARLRRRPLWRNQLVVIEHAAEPGADGLFRKYGAVLIRGRIIPWHVIASRTWMVKGTFRVWNDEIAAEESRYNADNPHAEALARIFASANIEYGRADYGIVGGRLQIYEINTNPAIVGGPRKKRRTGRPRRPTALVDQLVEAFRGLARDSPAPRGTTIAMTPRHGAVSGLLYRGIRAGQSLVTLYLHRSGVR